MESQISVIATVAAVPLVHTHTHFQTALDPAMKLIAASNRRGIRRRACQWLSISAAMTCVLLVAPVEPAHAQKPLTDLWVAIMPSFNQSVTYANAAVNEPIRVWGRAWNGTAPYNAVLDYGDGTPQLVQNGLTATAAKNIGANHTYTTGGSKTVTLTVTDAAGRTYSRQAVIRVLLSPTHNDRINMAIEKALLHLYNRQTQKGTLQTWWWADDSHEYRIGTAGSILLAFEENGHLATNDYEQDIYAETVMRGVNWLVARAGPLNIGLQNGQNPDSNGNNRGVVFPGPGGIGSHVYAHSLATMGVTMAFPNAVAAAASLVPAGLSNPNGQTYFTGASYYTLVIDALDLLNWNQSDDAAWKGWRYSMVTADSGDADGSTNQWPNMAYLFAEERYGYVPMQWVINNSVVAYQSVQNANGAIGYNNSNHWLNNGKTGGGLVGYFLGGKLVGDNDVNRAINFLAGNWMSLTQTDPFVTGGGWIGEFYAMYAIKKGFQLQGVETITVGGLARNWYDDMSGWLLGNAALIGPTLGSSIRNQTNAFGQMADGSWNSVKWPIGVIGSPANEIETAHAILVLTKTLTEPLPVAIIAAIGEQSARVPGPFNLDGSGSYHLDPNKSIIEWKWILDAPATPDWDNPTATGQLVSVNPGWNTVSTHTVTLRVKDNSDPPNFATVTRNITVTLNDVAPIARAIPTDHLPPIYTAAVGETITLDGSDSYDPEGDPIVSYAWDLNGDGQFGTVADSSLDGSGQNAQGITAQVTFTSVYNGQVGLQVCSLPDIVGAVVKCSNNPAAIDIYATPTDLRVASVTASNLVLGVSADITAVLESDEDSLQDYNGVSVKFYNDDPFTTGVQIGSNFTVDLPVGGSAVVSANLPLSPGQQYVYVKVDANNLIAESDEANNAGRVYVANRPPVAVARNVIVAADGNCQGFVLAAEFNNGSTDPDGDALMFSIDPVGPYPLGTTVVVLTVSDGKVSSTANASVTVEDRTPPTLADAGVNGVVECPALPVFLPPIARDTCDPSPAVLEVSDMTEPGLCAGTYSRTKTWIARDAAGNESASVSQTIVIVDTTPPMIAGQGANMTIECPTEPTFTPPSASDSCDENPGIVEVSDVTEPGVCPGTYSRKVTWKAVDCSGNESGTVSQTITVVDSTPPVMVCLPDLVIASDPASCEAASVNLGTPQATDECCNPDITNDAPASFPLGVTMVTWTARDPSGNTAMCVQNVTVLASVAVALKGIPDGSTSLTVKKNHVFNHRIDLQDCMGTEVSTGVTVEVGVLGIDGSTGAIFQNVIEDLKGKGTDGTAESDAILTYKGKHWEFKLSTKNFVDTNTISGPRYYELTVSVIDNATQVVVGTETLIIETKK